MFSAFDMDPLILRNEKPFEKCKMSFEEIELKKQEIIYNERNKINWEAARELAQYNEQETVWNQGRLEYNQQFSIGKLMYVGSAENLSFDGLYDNYEPQCNCPPADVPQEKTLEELEASKCKLPPEDVAHMMNEMCREDHQRRKKRQPMPLCEQIGYEEWLKHNSKWQAEYNAMIGKGCKCWFDPVNHSEDQNLNVPQSSKRTVD